MAKQRRKAASTRSAASTARKSARGSVQKFLDQTGRNENDVVRFSDLRALEGYGGGDTPSSPGDGTDGAGAGEQGATS